MRRAALVFVGLVIAAGVARAAPFQSALAPAGIQADHVYDLWHVMLATCTVVFVAIVVALGIALARAPRSSEATPPDLAVVRAPERGPTRAVAIAAAISIAGLLVLLTASVMTDRAIASLPLENGLVIQVSAQQWWWQATYDADTPSRMFDTANELHIPVGRPVVLKLQSPDVIHSLWVPNLAGKKDLIPGRTTALRLRADQPGIYRGQCAEFCGFQHAKMALLVIAEHPEEYERWAQSQRESARMPESDLEKRGQRVFLTAPCVMCHAIQGTPANGKTGPDLTHVASRRTLAAATVPNTLGYLAGWIVDPQHIKPGTNMPAITLPPDDLRALLAYLESLR